MNHDDQARINDMMDELDEHDPTAVQRVLDEIAQALERRRQRQDIEEAEVGLNDQEDVVRRK